MLYGVFCLWCLRRGADLCECVVCDVCVCGGCVIGVRGFLSDHVFCVCVMFVSCEYVECAFDVFDCFVCIFGLAECNVCLCEVWCVCVWFV